MPGRGQIAHHVLPLVPLTALDRDVSAETSCTAARRPFAPSRTTSNPCGARKPRATSSCRKAAQTRLFSVAVCAIPRMRFSPVVVTPRAITIWSDAKCFPSSSSTSHSRSSCRRSCNCRSAVALVRMKSDAARSTWPSQTPPARPRPPLHTRGTTARPARGETTRHPGLVGFAATHRSSAAPRLAARDRGRGSP